MQGRKTIRTSFLTTVLILLLCQQAVSAIYRYTDKDGVIHFTNAPTSPDYEWVMHETRDLEAARNTVLSLDEIIARVSRNYGVEEHLVKAIIKVESDFDPDAVSEDGARGLMQLMPGTARLMGVRDVHDPYENILGGVRYLSRLLKSFSWNIPLAVAAYNAGSGPVRKHMAVPPIKETRQFVKKVLHYYEKYRNAGMER